MTPKRALKIAIEKAGGEAALARALDITPQAVNQWVTAPALRVLEIERATGHRVTRHQLRPDLYPDEPGNQMPQSAAA